MIEPHLSPRFEDRIASYSKWRIAVRGSVTHVAVPRGNPRNVGLWHPAEGTNEPVPSLRCLLPGRGVHLGLGLEPQLSQLVAFARGDAEQLLLAGQILRG